MEALAAVSLAGNVAQFLEYAINAARLAFQITGNAKPEQRIDIENTIQNVRQSLRLLEETKEKVSRPIQDETLHSLVTSCLRVATEIKAVVDNLEDKGKGTWKLVEGLQKTGYLIYKGKDLQRLSEQLFTLRSEISAHLIVLMEQQQRDIQETLASFSASHNAYQEQFGKHLYSSLNYLKNISKRIDSLTVSSLKGTGGALYIPSAEDDVHIDFQETLEKTAFEFYSRNHHALYRDLDSLTENKQRLILQTLSFSQLHEREFTISEAHQRTFEWIFNGNSGETGFVGWLRGTNGIFWVAGKAGSGKSTLMKFLAEHRTTHQILAEWADSLDYRPIGSVIVAKHYFWSIGTTMQRSQEGLMRSILLQILLQRPRLVPKICPERWAAPYIDSFYPWNRSQLKSAMALLGHTDVKMCLFIDGLDEYGGDHGELVDVLSQLSHSTNIKICVSSRPWIEFVDAFDASPWKIYLQDLTRQDIIRYATDKLEGNDKFRRLRSHSKEDASEFIQNVTKRSEGVFLWVYLVVRSLLRGLRNDDSLSILRTRLDELPVDLEEYFERMLLSIENIYRPRTARLFLTLCYARTSFPVLTFFFLNLDDDAQSSDAASKLQQEPLELLKNWPDVDSDQFEALIMKKRQLVAQCKDMIHVSPDPKAHILFGERVGFLHRTIVDFIKTDNIFKRLQTLSGPSFDPRRLLFDASLGQARSLIHLHRLTYIRTHLSQWILGCLFYAYEMEATTPDRYDMVFVGLDELEAIILRGFARWDFRHAMETLLGRSDVVSFLDLAARCDLKAYVQWRHPHCNLATILDKRALGWRSPCRVLRGSVVDFEICPLTEEELDSWRLGTYVDETSGSQTDGRILEKVAELNHQQQDDRVPEIPVMLRETRRRHLLQKLTALFS